MKVEISVLKRISEAVAGITHEIGGIMGSTCGEVITRVIIDKGMPVDCACTYKPDIGFLNKNISKWENEGIDFAGMFHTHFGGVKTLSKADEEYIVRIMNSMPHRISELYFPIYVLPDNEIIGYKAIREDNNIKIICEGVEKKCI